MAARHSIDHGRRAFTGERAGRGTSRALHAGALDTRRSLEDGARETPGLTAYGSPDLAGERVHGHPTRLDAADDALTIVSQVWARSARDHPRHDPQGDDDDDAQRLETRLERGHDQQQSPYDGGDRQADPGRRILARALASLIQHGDPPSAPIAAGSRLDSPREYHRKGRAVLLTVSSGAALDDGPPLPRRQGGRGLGHRSEA